MFAWDERKNRRNLRKHGISFEDAAVVFGDATAVSYVERIVDGEERWHAIGFAAGFLMVVVHTWEVCDGEEIIRIISARKADQRERNLFHSAQ